MASWRHSFQLIKGTKRRQAAWRSRTAGREPPGAHVSAVYFQGMTDKRIQFSPYRGTGPVPPTSTLTPNLQDQFKGRLQKIRVARQTNEKNTCCASEAIGRLCVSLFLCTDYER
jgi:hypothetical protein